MKNRILGQGRASLTVSEIGLGCMGMSEFYGIPDPSSAETTLRLALEKGVTFFDTADQYAYGDNEILIGRILNEQRNKVIIATKGGVLRDRNNPSFRGLDGSPGYIKKACEASLKRLNTEYIDLYYLHRQDPDVPIEITVQALSDLVREGKIRAIGLSEIDANTLRKAHSVHPVTAVQTEYSLWSRGVEREILPLCQELNIGFVPYSPLGRGFLTGKITKPDSFEENDYRRGLPRFSETYIEENLIKINNLKEIAVQKNITLAQLALAWVQAQAENIVAIPGTKKAAYLIDNINAASIILTQEELAEINAIFPVDGIRGSRYPESAMKAFNYDD